MRMSPFKQEFLTDLGTRVPFVVWVALTLLLAQVGPFGSYDIFTFGGRLMFWAPLLAIGIGLSTAVRAYVYGTLGLRDFRRGSLLIAVLICGLVSPPLHLVVRLLFENRLPHLPALTEIAVVVFSVVLGVCAVRVSTVAAAPQMAEAPMPPPQPPQPPARLMERIEPSLQGSLIAISVRDHYVDVWTDKGRSSLLLRFGDAMKEAVPTDGAQVHRSHWVAWSAVEAVERDAGRVTLRLRQGLRVPVSKNHRLKLEFRGLI